jgi:hypothetical protein
LISLIFNVLEIFVSLVGFGFTFCF